MTLRSRSGPRIPPRSPRVISLYTGAGGLDYGFEAAGFQTCVAVDFDADSCGSIRSNREWPVLQGDIHGLSSQQILGTAGLRKGEAELLIGGPPCQPFSKSGYWANGQTRGLKDPRAATLDEFMRCVRDTLPRVFLLENVHGINYSGKEEGFQLLARLTGRINRTEGTDYRLSWRVLNSADYGVPQVRRRFFLVGHREGERFDFPEPTFRPEEKQRDRQRRLFAAHLDSYVTAWDAIGGIDPSGTEDLRVRGHWADLLPSIPEGENYLWHTSRKGGLPLFGWRRRYWSFLLKLAKARPSWTIQAQPGPAIGPFHWENRLLTIREMARLQTFPAEISFVGGRQSVQKQIGNAVPSLLAEVLAREIARQLLRIKVAKNPCLAIGPVRPIPPPEAVRSVPGKYRDLIGEHSPHPGTGKGRTKARAEA